MTTAEDVERAKREAVRGSGLGPAQGALLEFIRAEHGRTGAPVSRADMEIAQPIPNARLTTMLASLVGRGLIRVVEKGVAAWVPVETTR